MVFDMTAAVSGQNDSRFGLPPPRRGGKIGFTGLPPWRPGKTTVVWGSRCRVRVIKALLPPSRRRVQAKRQPFRGAAAASGVKKGFAGSPPPRRGETTTVLGWKRDSSAAALAGCPVARLPGCPVALRTSPHIAKFLMACALH
jgi:hypothetical protein